MIYIQQAATGKWLDEHCGWIPEQREAKCFRSTVEALDFCLAHRLTGIQVVLCFADPKFNITIQVTPRYEGAPDG